MTLPALREELSLFPGPTAADGSPTWSLQDPSRNRFFRIDWPTFLILSHWHLDDPQAIVEAVAEDAPLDLDVSDVESVTEFLNQFELLRCPTANDTARLHQTVSGQRLSIWTWLLHHYLFFRIPLVHPDQWLNRIAPHFDFFFSKTFLKVTLTTLGIGLFSVFRQWEQFTTTLIDTLSPEGLAGYAVALVGVKILHELGHALTAKRMGCRVPSMGVAFLVMWPVAYTDVNEAWKLKDRRQRLAIGSAGILTELAIAAWATLGWGLLPDGGLRGALFLLATTTWISTLAVNASPFLRFDGYFLLSDWLDIANLHSRSFALARWKLRELLFKLNETKPEEFPPERQRFLIAFAWVNWLYRLVLFVGIAFLVYHFFFKLLGVFLFVVEIGWFIWLPLRSELREWGKRLPAIRASRRTSRSVFLALSVFAFGFIPWNFRVSGQGLLKAEQVFVIYAPTPAQLMAPLPPSGTTVAKGEPLAVLFSPDLEKREHIAASKLERVQWQIDAAGIDPAIRPFSQVLKQEAETLASEIKRIADEKTHLLPTAPFSGRIIDPALNLRVGDWVAGKTKLALLVNADSWQVDTYLEEQDIARISIGDSATFFPETPSVPSIHLTVSNIDWDASHSLPEPILTSAHGGSILVRTQEHALVPERAVFHVTLKANVPLAADSQRMQRGQIVIHGKPKSLFGTYLQTIAAVLIRESAW